MMKEGLYKIEFHTSQGRGRGIIYATGGKLRGGNSAFAFVGSYSVDGEEILARVTTTRHTEDPQFKPLFGTDVVTLVLRGAANGNLIDFEGTALQLPSLPIKIVFSPLSD
ncbi:GrlR family regulatory protein [Bradyrhizobium prioriisuperbiae]|uniref:GrlR family regulatory protein n=1 Tax=Bradyrhizobium prioriisuperbiae TaxID=2854389 RepID=UPI0028EFE92F|nr:GrlR family regulatory protein [Bradyrhizobium prioritasuperba]